MLQSGILQEREIFCISTAVLCMKDLFGKLTASIIALDRASPRLSATNITMHICKVYMYAKVLAGYESKPTCSYHVTIETWLSRLCNTQAHQCCR